VSELYRRCHHVTPNGRHLDKSPPGIPHQINIADPRYPLCYGLVLVEPCEHGNYARHIVDGSIRSKPLAATVSWKWCKGAGLEDIE